MTVDDDDVGHGPGGHELVAERAASATSDLPAAASSRAPAGAPQIVFPPDGRRRVKPTDRYPWNTIGLLVMRFPNGRLYTGTGTLVDPRHVLTAAHNVFGRDIGGDATTVTFVPACDERTAPYGVFDVAKTFVTEEYRRLSPADPNQNEAGNVIDYTLYTEDYAIIRLKEPVPLPFMGMIAADDRSLRRAGARITGYPGDKPSDTMWTDTGPLPNEVDEHFLFYRLSTYRGESGAGIVVDLALPEGKAVVGVHVAGDPSLDTNFGVRLTEVELDTIRGWMTGP